MLLLREGDSHRTLCLPSKPTSPAPFFSRPCLLFVRGWRLVGRAVHRQGEPAMQARWAVRGDSECEPSLTGWAVGSGHVSLSAPAPHLPCNGVDHTISTGPPCPQSVFFMCAEVATGGSERPGDCVSFWEVERGWLTLVLMGLTIFSAFMESWANLMGQDGNPLNCKVRPEGQRGTQRHGRLGEADSSVHV